MGSYEKAAPEHRVNPANPNVDIVSFGLRIVFHDAAQPIRWTTPRPFLAAGWKCSPIKLNICGNRGKQAAFRQPVGREIQAATEAAKKSCPLNLPPCHVRRERPFCHWPGLIPSPHVHREYRRIEKHEPALLCKLQPPLYPRWIGAGYQRPGSLECRTQSCQRK